MKSLNFDTLYKIMCSHPSHWCRAAELLHSHQVFLINKFIYYLFIYLFIYFILELTEAPCVHFDFYSSLPLVKIAMIKISFCFMLLYLYLSDFKLFIGISFPSFEIPDEPSCYVRECRFNYDLLLELSRGSASHILLFIVCTVIHNCSSLGSFSLQHLGSI